MLWLFISIVILGLLPAALPWIISRRLNGYRLHFVAPSEKPNNKHVEPFRVAIIGAGVAGMRTAFSLAKRGISVEIYEANHYIGGKLGSWKIENPVSIQGESWVSHGFHGIFGHYYNFRSFLKELGCDNQMARTTDYEIFGLNGTRFGFKNLWKTPVLNLVSMALKKVFPIGPVVKAPTRDLMRLFLEYDKKTTFQALDGVSFSQFDDMAKLPASLKLSFHTFGRAFFASPQKLSLAELIKCFHYYYLSQDSGLLYEYPTRDYEPWILKPFRDQFLALGGVIHLSTPVSSLAKKEQSFLVNGNQFDAVVVATSSAHAKTLIPTLKDSALTDRFSKMAVGERYAIWRIWIDKDIRQHLAMFVITEKELVLDSVSLFHRYEKETIESMQPQVKAVLELHCYAMSDNVNDDNIRSLFRAELEAHFPELKGFEVLHEHMQIRNDFTAFHVGQATIRPGTESGIKGLTFAGDWVDMPIPAMLLEAATSSGLMAANSIFRQLQLNEEPIETVALQGALFGIPQSGGQKAALQQLVFDAQQMSQEP
jgi:carotenoid phi-ring synthase / carotenoid chi-ring synthase